VHQYFNAAFTLAAARGSLMLQIKATHANIKRALHVTKWDEKAEAKRAQLLLLLLGFCARISKFLLSNFSRSSKTVATYM
jgi:hypothetical protein